jgi:hypothetical protein
MRPPATITAGLRAGLARAGEGRLRRALPGLAGRLAAGTLGAGLLETATLRAGPAAAADGAAPRPPAAPEMPSGQALAPADMVLERQGDGQVWLVLRYLAPRIAREGGDLGYDAVAGDLDALCEGPGRQAAAAAEPAPDQVVIVLMDRPVPRGVPDPEATVFISAYDITPEGCRWR